MAVYRESKFKTFIDSIGRDTLNEVIDLFKRKGINGHVDMSMSKPRSSIILENDFELFIEYNRAYLRPPSGILYDLPPLQEYTKEALTELVVSAYSEFLKEIKKIES